MHTFQHSPTSTHIHPYLSISIHIYPFPCMPININPYSSLSVHSHPYPAISLNVHSYSLLFVHSHPIPCRNYPYSSIAIYTLLYPLVSVYIRTYLYLSISSHINTYLSISIHSLLPVSKILGWESERVISDGRRATWDLIEINDISNVEGKLTVLVAYVAVSFFADLRYRLLQ